MPRPRSLTSLSSTTVSPLSVKSSHSITNISRPSLKPSHSPTTTPRSSLDSSHSSTAINSTQSYWTCPNCHYTYPVLSPNKADWRCGDCIKITSPEKAKEESKASSFQAGLKELEVGNRDVYAKNWVMKSTAEGSSGEDEDGYHENGCLFWVGIWERAARKVRRGWVVAREVLEKELGKEV